MEDKTHIHLNNMLYSCMEKKQRGNEQFVHEHSLGYIISGEMHQLTALGTNVGKAGSIALVRRNQLIKAAKVPPPNGEFKSLNIFFGQEFLRGYAVEKKLPPITTYSGDPVLLLPNDPYLKGYFDSLLPYFEQGAPPTPSLAELKTTEAIELLLRLNPALINFLFDFSEPYKIDLQGYMNKNYMFNVPAAQFAKLTGRSLAGFKRDFARIFKTSPGVWLQQKRLAEAYYLIREKGCKPSEVYLDVGFENLSHFSYVFKKAYRVAPSRVN